MRYCTNCGKQVTAGRKFCTDCGQTLVAEEKPLAMATGKQAGSKTASILLAVLLGMSVFCAIYLSSELSQHKTKLEATRTELATTRTELATTRTELAATETRLAAANAQISSLTRTAEANKFHFYYVKLKQQFGVDKLDSFLTEGQWIRDYQAGAFDCSNMSAYLERVLENAGFRTVIAIGQTPGKPGTHHAWLLVEASPGAYIPVEATQPSIVWWHHPHFDDYFRYDRTFETIQEALDYSYQEFQWWKG